MSSPVELPSIIQEQILRLKKRGQKSQLETLRQRLPIIFQKLLDDILISGDAQGSWNAPDVATKNSINNQGISTNAPNEVITADENSNAEFPTLQFDNTCIIDEIREIKGLLEVFQQTSGFRVGPSLTYEGIQEQVRIQLVTDNVRMENALLDTSTYERFGEELAFRRFCVFAFFQIEELLNLYYHTKYGDDVRKLRADWKELRPAVTFDEKSDSLTRIPTGTKILAYTRSSSAGDTMNSLRHVRNMEEHRCTTVLRKYASDIPKLQIQYDALRLNEKIAEAQKNGRKYEKTSDERELEGRLTAIRFLAEPASNKVIIRGVLKRLYEAVLSLKSK